MHPLHRNSSKSGLGSVRGPKRCFKSWGRFWRDRESSMSETRRRGLKHRNLVHPTIWGDGLSNADMLVITGVVFSGTTDQ